MMIVVVVIGLLVSLLLLTTSATAFVPSSSSCSSTSHRELLVGATASTSRLENLLLLPNNHFWRLYQTTKTTTTTTTTLGPTTATTATTTTRRTSSNSKNTIPSFDLTSTLTSSAVLSLQAVKECVDQICQVFKNAVTNYWWLFPLTLCLVPVYTKAVLQTTPVTPDFWKLVSLDFLHHSHPATATTTISAFLLSNISYFLTGAFFLLRNNNNNNNNDTQSSSSSSLTAAGYWVLLAGSMSTVFHTVQAVGDYSVAEALCYLDHGVAGTAILYFWRTFSHPSRRTTALGLAGLVALASPSSNAVYAVLHSLWHFLSAATAVVWAMDAPPPPPQQQEQLQHNDDGALVEKAASA